MKNILLVEDDKTMQSLIKTLLEFDGFSVKFPTEFTPESILSDILAQQPEAIIMDVHLRQSSGLDILKVIKSNPQTQNIKIMMSSGENYKDVCLSTGADAFLMKPYMPDQLVSWLKSVI